MFRCLVNRKGLLKNNLSPISNIPLQHRRCLDVCFRQLGQKQGPTDTSSRLIAPRRADRHFFGGRFPQPENTPPTKGVRCFWVFFPPTPKENTPPQPKASILLGFFLGPPASPPPRRRLRGPRSGTPARRTRCCRWSPWRARRPRTAGRRGDLRSREGQNWRRVGFVVMWMYVYI